jgi:hypothetical protein
VNNDGSLAMAKYYTWNETIIGNGSSAPVEDVYPHIQPGDRMFSQVFVANCPPQFGCGPPNPSITPSLSVVYYIEDVTAGWNVPPQIVTLTTDSGLAAEWIIERAAWLCSNSDNSTELCDLANYDGVGALDLKVFAIALVCWAIAETGSGNWLAWDSPNDVVTPLGNNTITMTGCVGTAYSNQTCELPQVPDPFSIPKPYSVDPSLIEFDWYNFH